MTQILACLLALLFSLSGPAMGENGDFGRCTIAAKGAGGLANEIGIMRAAAEGKGNFGIGSASTADAMRLGRSWVGEGSRIASDGKTLVSKDGLRVFRPPSFKPKLGKTQANFEQKASPGGQPFSNGHLDIQ